MNEKIRLPVPVYYLLLDAVGALLLGLGLAKYFAGLDIIPPVMRFENYDIAFMVFGVVIMLPAIFHIIGKARGGNS